MPMSASEAKIHHFKRYINRFQRRDLFSLEICEQWGFTPTYIAKQYKESVQNQTWMCTDILDVTEPFPTLRSKITSRDVRANYELGVQKQLRDNYHAKAILKAIVADPRLRKKLSPYYLATKFNEAARMRAFSEADHRLESMTADASYLADMHPLDYYTYLSAALEDRHFKSILPVMDALKSNPELLKIITPDIVATFFRASLSAHYSEHNLPKANAVNYQELMFSILQKAIDMPALRSAITQSDIDDLKASHQHTINDAQITIAAEKDKRPDDLGKSDAAIAIEHAHEARERIKWALTHPHDPAIDAYLLGLLNGKKESYGDGKINHLQILDEQTTQIAKKRERYYMAQYVQQTHGEKIMWQFLFVLDDVRGVRAKVPPLQTQLPAPTLKAV